MKVYIMTDLEGVAGVFDFESQAYPNGRYYEESRSLLTQEVNAAIEGSLLAGAEEILVIDGHGYGGIKYEELHSKAKVFLGKPVPKPFCFLDESFAAVFLIGHHAMSGVEDGNLNHTYCPTSIANMWLNGKKIGEIGILIILAGCFNVPVLLITGDRAACEEARSYIPNIEVAIVKEGINRTAAICLSKESSRGLIAEKAKKALQRKNEIEPYYLKGPFELVTEYTSSALAWAAYQRYGVEKVDSKTTKIKADNILDLAKKKQ
ncbi:hypothetical protein CEE34_02375 [Candidatus Aerophobetes bacterium Ae_b3a]|nr:MAG: hypothetical protein CEE34_02375 [Candidatus Aerophobetes bacterium Ae_b3a]